MKPINRKSYFRGAGLLVLAAFVSAGCATNGAARFYTNYSTVEPAEILRESCHAEDVNGSFPDAVYIKTRTQTFNTYHYYILQDGFIWYKGINPAPGPREWTLFMGTGLPHNRKNKGFLNPSYIIEISADADELVALSSEGYFYRICFDWIFSRKKEVWFDRQGWPMETSLRLDERTVKNHAWALGKRNDQVKYYEDTFGNQHHNGTQEIATIYMLLEDGQEICYADTGLPSDFSRNYLGPERGAFKARALSASASTIFLINEAGEMYTRIADFDIIGCDPMFFKYTYIPYKSDIPGTEYPSNLTPWALPPEDWRAQPPIPLEGQAAITSYITISQNGQGNGARELRVAGLNPQGETGYWSKAIFGETWSFVNAPLSLPENAFLDTSQFPGLRGPSPDASFRGYAWEGNVKEPDWEYEIPDFNILEGACSLRIIQGKETCTVLLHPVEMWTYMRRNYQPGRLGPPKVFLVTLDIPAGALEGLSPAFTEKLQAKFGVHDKELFRYLMEADMDYILIQDGGEGIIFLTQGRVSNSLPEFHRSWQYEEYEEVLRYHSPELRVQGGPVFTREQYAELRRRIEPNRQLLNELRERIAQFESLKNVVSTSRIAYSTLDLIANITFLYTIDFPKIYTITRFGGEILTINKAYVDMISDSRIWRDKKLVELLELRIESYTCAAEALARGALSASLPLGFAETIQEYWESAGFPGGLEGMFQANGQQSPARVLASSLTQDFFGWLLFIGDVKAPDCVLFVEPQNTARAIFSRRGKIAAERPYRLKGTMYLLGLSGAGPYGALFEDMVAAQLKRGKRTEVEIRFDGRELVIRKKHFPRRDIIIFQGTFSIYPGSA